MAAQRRTSSPRARPERKPPARAADEAPTGGTPPSRTGWSLVGIGAMPGDATTLARVLPAAAATLAMVVVPYDPDEPLELPAATAGGATVVEARAGVAVEPNHVYVARREARLVVEGGRFERAGKLLARSPLDAMLASLAKEAGPRATAVLLSGAAREGLDGLRAIKARGGTVIAQEPASAVFDEAPRAAIASGLVDLVLAPTAIARELARLGGRADANEAPAAADFDDGDEDDPPDEPLRRILALLKSRFRVDLGHYKLTTIRRRVERRMSMSRFDDLAAWAESLRGDPAALEALHDDLFIHVTRFFRDPESFDALREHVFPALVKERRDGDALRVWVPGCSTGEEAYSLAIALTEFLEAQGLAFKVQIFATDISDGAIDQARRAVYPESVREDLGPKRLERFFEPVAGGYKIRKQVRDLCVVSRHDVTNNPPFANLDLVSCRNVLIYFGPALQKRIVPIFHYGLKPGGFLWLGHSETAGAASSLFTLVDKQHRIYSKVATPTSYLQIVQNRFTTENLELPRRFAREAHPAADLHQSADQLVLLKYGPPGVVVNQDGDILQYRGRTSPYLEPVVGAPSHALLKMAHPQLVTALRTLLRAAREQNAAQRREGVRCEAGGAARKVNLEVAPLNPAAPASDRQYLVLFEEAVRGRPAPAAATSPTRASRAGRQTSKDHELEQLRHEVASLREHAQLLVEQFDSSQEELTSANEELQATNEEFQSTNEELETAKEELQSANEELTTTNDELHSRNQELVEVNEKLRRGEDRFRLMVESVKDYAIYLLDPDGRVSSWNEGARRLKGYEASEILGRHYSRFFPPEEVAEGAPEVELERARIDGRFETEGFRLRKDGSRFWANVVVTRVDDSQGALVGFAKVTRDLSERRRTEQELERREKLFRLMIGGVRDYAIFTLDPDGRVSSWNEGARRLKGYEEQEILGRHLAVFYPPEEVAAGRVERDLAAALANGHVEDEGWRVRKDGSRFFADMVLTRVNDADGRLLGFTKVTRDLTERRRAEEALRAANEGLEARVRARTEELERALRVREDFLSIASHELKTPLTALSLQLEGLQSAVTRRPDPARAARKLDTAIRQSERLTSLIETLLDVSRLGSKRLQLQVETFDLAELVRDVAERLSDVAERAKSPIVVAAGTPATGAWDRSRLDQVVMNLVANALKYGAGRPVDVGLSESADEVELSVKDHGIGIAPEDQERIFGRFERAVPTNHYGGLGLGLYIARQIVEAHGGAIRVESTPGAGAEFVVTLPRVTNVPPAAGGGPDASRQR